METSRWDRQKNEEKNKAMIEKTFHGAPLQYELSETLSHEFQKSPIFINYNVLFQ
jgi:hypothetical protein